MAFYKHSRNACIYRNILSAFNESLTVFTASVSDTHRLKKRKVLKSCNSEQIFRFFFLNEDYFSLTIFLVTHTSRGTPMEIRPNLDFFIHPCYLSTRGIFLLFGSLVANYLQLWLEKSGFYIIIYY